MDSINPAAFALPIFLAAVVIESLLARRSKKEGVYHFGTAVSDMACGVVFQALEVFFNLVLLAVYAWIFEHLTVVTWSEGSPWPWIIAFVGVDFMFYWWHRHSHVVNVFWAVHGVHHQSEDYNLAVALRQPAFEPITWFFYYVPLAFLGVSPVVYLAAYALNRFYQFWFHTQLVDKFPAFIEYIFNTPSHHRVHHGVQDQYLDKNYGAILIIWDRMFGTFEPEVEEVLYGTTVPIRSYDPLWANFQYFAYMADLSRQARTTREKLWAWVAHPAWLPEGVEPLPKPEDRKAYEKYLPRTTGIIRTYVAIHFAVLGTLATFFVLYEPQWSAIQLVMGSGLILMAAADFLGLIEGKDWAVRMEKARLALTLLAFLWLAAAHLGLWPLVAWGAGLALVSGFSAALLGDD